MDRPSTGMPPRDVRPLQGPVVRLRAPASRCDTMTSSVAVPVGLCRRTAVLRPPTVALCSERLTTGRPSTSTSL